MAARVKHFSVRTIHEGIQAHIYGDGEKSSKPPLHWGTWRLILCHKPRSGRLPIPLPHFGKIQTDPGDVRAGQQKTQGAFSRHRPRLFNKNVATAEWNAQLGGRESRLPNPATKLPPWIDFFGPSVSGCLSCPLASPRLRWYFGRALLLDWASAPQILSATQHLANLQVQKNPMKAMKQVLALVCFRPSLLWQCLSHCPPPPTPHLFAPDQRC